MAGRRIFVRGRGSPQRTLPDADDAAGSQEVAATNCVPVKSPCNWDTADFEGFTFSPDYLPTGDDVLYLTGATSNYGAYTNAQNDAMIGTPVTAQDLMFWINMDRVPQDWFDFSPGGFPANVSDIRAVSSTELTMTMMR
jgi:hypothetical protein